MAALNDHEDERCTIQERVRALRQAKAESKTLGLPKINVTKEKGMRKIVAES